MVKSVEHELYQSIISDCEILQEMIAKFHEDYIESFKNQSYFERAQLVGLQINQLITRLTVISSGDVEISRIIEQLKFSQCYINNIISNKEYYDNRLNYVLIDLKDVALKEFFANIDGCHKIIDSAIQDLRIHINAPSKPAVKKVHIKTPVNKNANKSNISFVPYIQNPTPYTTYLPLDMIFDIYSIEWNECTWINRFVRKVNSFFQLSKWHYSQKFNPYFKVKIILFLKQKKLLEKFPNFFNHTNLLLDDCIHERELFWFDVLHDLLSNHQKSMALSTVILAQNKDVSNTVLMSMRKILLENGVKLNLSAIAQLLGNNISCQTLIKEGLIVKKDLYGDFKYTLSLGEINLSEYILFMISLKFHENSIRNLIHTLNDLLKMQIFPRSVDRFFDNAYQYGFLNNAKVEPDVFLELSKTLQIIFNNLSDALKAKEVLNYSWYITKIAIRSENNYFIKYFFGLLYSIDKTEHIDNIKKHTLSIKELHGPNQLSSTGKDFSYKVGKPLQLAKILTYNLHYVEIFTLLADKLTGGKIKAILLLAADFLLKNITDLPHEIIPNWIIYYKQWLEEKLSDKNNIIWSDSDSNPFKVLATQTGKTQMFNPNYYNLFHDYMYNIKAFANADSIPELVTIVSLDSNTNDSLSKNFDKRML